MIVPLVGAESHSRLAGNRPDRPRFNLADKRVEAGCLSIAAFEPGQIDVRCSLTSGFGPPSKRKRDFLTHVADACPHQPRPALLSPCSVVHLRLPIPLHRVDRQPAQQGRHGRVVQNPPSGTICRVPESSGRRSPDSPLPSGRERSTRRAPRMAGTVPMTDSESPQFRQTASATAFEQLDAHNQSNNQMELLSLSCMRDKQPRMPEASS